MKVRSCEELQTALSEFLTKADPDSEARVQVEIYVMSLGNVNQIEFEVKLSKN